MDELISKKPEKTIISVELVKQFEKRNNLVFPENLYFFLEKYEGALLLEDRGIFEIYSGIERKVHKVLYLESSKHLSIQSIIDSYKNYNISNYIPFAVDPSEWIFNISINPDTYGQVWLFEFDHGEMKYLAPSLEDFLEKLR